MTVVVVESAKTINKYLGKGFTVLASYGHLLADGETLILSPRS